MPLSTKVGPVTLGIYTTTGGEVSTLVSKTTVGGGGEKSPALTLTGPTLVVI
jgi:hypothetical protein